MLYVIYDRDFKSWNYETKRFEHEKEKEWRVGEGMPVIAPNRIVEVQADGEEKQHLEDLMGATVKREVSRFYGDLAKTIYLNLL